MPIVFADYGLGEALLTVLSLFFLIIFVSLLITILTDLFHDDEISGLTKAAWAFFLIFVPYFTTFIYLVVRGKGMSGRRLKVHISAYSSG